MNLEFIIIIVVTGGWDSSVGIAVCYVVVSPMLRPPVGARFCAPMHIFPEEHLVSYTMGAGFFTGGKMAVRWRLQCIVGVECR